MRTVGVWQNNTLDGTPGGDDFKARDYARRDGDYPFSPFSGQPYSPVSDFNGLRNRGRQSSRPFPLTKSTAAFVTAWESQVDAVKQVKPKDHALRLAAKIANTLFADWDEVDADERIRQYRLRVSACKGPDDDSRRR